MVVTGSDLEIENWCDFTLTVGLQSYSDGQFVCQTDYVIFFLETSFRDVMQKKDVVVI